MLIDMDVIQSIEEVKKIIASLKVNSIKDVRLINVAPWMVDQIDAHRLGLPLECNLSMQLYKFRMKRVGENDTRAK